MELGNVNEELIQTIVTRVMESHVFDGLGSGKGYEVAVEASGRHVHLSAEAYEALFGKGSQLESELFLSQPGEFRSQHRVKLVSTKANLDQVAVLGPLRPKTQIELSMTDAIHLGIKAPINTSGDLTHAADILLVGPRGHYNAKGAVIVAKAHIHLRPQDAEAAGVRDRQHVSLRVTGDRGAVLENVVIRVKDNYRPAAHIDYDEANACGLNKNSRAFILDALSSSQLDLPSSLISDPTSPSISVARKLITEEGAKELLGQSKEILLPKGTIITPAAKDVLSQAGINFQILS